MQDKAKCLVGRRQYENHALTIFFSWVTKDGTSETLSSWGSAPGWNRQSRWKIPSTAHSPWWASQQQTVNTFLAQTDFKCWLVEGRMIRDNTLTGLTFHWKALWKAGFKKPQSVARGVGSLPAPGIHVKKPKEYGPKGKFLTLVHSIRALRQKDFKKAKEIIQSGFVLPAWQPWRPRLSSRLRI